MNQGIQDIAEGSWKELKGKVKEAWGKLTDDEIDQIAGKREEFIGAMQRRYGMAREDAEKQFDKIRNSV